MREIVQETLLVDGRTMKVTYINDPNIDDILISESQAYAAELYTGVKDGSRRVPLNLREMFTQFGVQR